MKRIVYSLFAAALVALSGCSDEIAENPVIPAQTGDEITFGSSLTDVQNITISPSSGTQTRTIYGDDPVNGAYPVYWEAGDQISIYCPEAAQGNIVKYKITPDENDASTSSAVVKVNENEAGLQWGTAEVHHFSAIYPAEKIEGVAEGEGGNLIASIPANQDPVSWKSEQNEKGGITWTGVANTDYAYMWAYNTHSKSDGGDVALKFKPWVTILDVEINGPESAGEEIKMSAVQIVSLTGETLNGRFAIDFNPVEDNEKNYPVYTEQGNPNATRSQISIQLYNQELNNRQGDFITLKQNDKIVIRFYLLPKDTNYDTNSRTDLQVRVTPFNSAVLTRTLNAEVGTQTGGILAHKVNKVILPSVSKTGPNYWMSSLDPNIYVTELSLPGSKMSYQTAENVSGRNAVYYQDLSIADQVTNGIRAFQIQTASTNTAWGPGNASDQVLYMTVAGNKTNTRFKDIVSEIATGLKTAEAAGKKQEYAFILLTATLGKCDGYGLWPNRTDGNLAWMDAIRNELAEMAANEETYRLYTGEITPNTTIDDVKGHIIIKVNYNDDDMGNHLSENDRIPAMFAKWGVFEDVSLPSDFTETSAYAINSMRWGTSHNVNNGALQWFYHEATRVGYNNNGGDETYAQKIGNIEDMWERSIGYYNSNSDHSMWFLNDLGGCYVNGIYSGGESQDGVDAWTQEVGPYATRLLQNRTEDATLGIVLINYANPENQYSGNLIQTIINNNFNFELRTSGSGQAETYNATYQNGGNAIGWDK